MWNNISLTGTVLGIWWGISLSMALDYFRVSGEIVMILSVCLILDFILWVADAYTKNKKKVTSKEMFKWLFRKITRRLLPFVVILILKWIGYDDVHTLTNSIFWILIATEWYSVIGHVYSINTGKTLPEIDAFEMLIEKIISVFKPVLDNKSKK